MSKVIAGPKRLARMFHRVSSRGVGDGCDDSTSELFAGEGVSTYVEVADDEEVLSARPDPATQQKAGEISGLAIVLVVCLAGCATFSGGSYSMLSTEQEIQLGAEVAAEVEKEQKVLDDPEIQAYITAIGENLARQSERQDVDYAFKVIDNPETVNAFALPGGYMYIYTGLMLQCENEAELASIMGHEIAHVAAQHHGESLTEQMGMNALLEIVTGTSSSALVETAAGMFLGVGGLKFSRNKERESDMLGMDYLVGAGYPPQPMVDFMQRVFVAMSGDQPGWTAWLSTHPASQSRVEYLSEKEAVYPPEIRNRTTRNTELYQERVLGPLKARAAESEAETETEE